MGLGFSLNACGAASGIVIPESLKAPCASTVGDLSSAQTIGDLSNAIVRGDSDLAVCDLKKTAIVEIAEANRRPWWPF